MKNREKRKRQVWARDRYVCHYCQRHLARGEATVDHIVPKTMGGPFAIWNLVTACEPCNTQKADKIAYCTCDFCWAAARNPGRRAVTRAWEWSVLNQAWEPR